jgi:hypothetical protein
VVYQRAEGLDTRAGALALFTLSALSGFCVRDCLCLPWRLARLDFAPDILRDHILRFSPLEWHTAIPSLD